MYFWLNRQLDITLIFITQCDKQTTTKQKYYTRKVVHRSGTALEPSFCNHSNQLYLCQTQRKSKKELVTYCCQLDDRCNVELKKLTQMKNCEFDKIFS